MEITIKVTGLEKVQKQLAALSGQQFKTALATSLNQAAGRVAKEMKADMARVFDRPTAYTLRSVKRNDATYQDLNVTIAPTYMGGKGIDPQKYLKAQVDGGYRRDKRAEVLLRRARILPDGMQMVIPRNPLPGSTDAYGNLKGGFIVQVISYFQAFDEMGFKANMTEARKKKIANKQQYSSLYNKQTYKSAMGYQLFVVNRNGQMKGVHDAKVRTSHLAPGIWARSGRHGATGIHRIWPVVMFTRSGFYTRRLDMEAIVRRVNPGELVNKWVRGHIRDAARQAGASA